MDELQQAYDSLFKELKKLGIKYTLKKKECEVARKEIDILNSQSKEHKRVIDENEKLKKENDLLNESLAKFSNPGENIKLFLNMTTQSDKRGLGYNTSGQCSRFGTK